MVYSMTQKKLLNGESALESMKPWGFYNTESTAHKKMFDFTLKHQEQGLLFFMCPVEWEE